jgi:ribosomal protein L24
MDSRVVVQKDDQVRIMRGRFNNMTGLVIAESLTSVKVEGAFGIRWYARSEVVRVS